MTNTQNPVRSGAENSSQHLEPDFLATTPNLVPFPANSFPAGRPRVTQVEGDLPPRKMALANLGENYGCPPGKSFAVLWEINDKEGPVFYSWHTPGGDRLKAMGLTMRSAFQDLFRVYPGAVPGGCPTLFPGDWTKENREHRHEEIRRWAEYELPSCDCCASHPERDPSSWSNSAEGWAYDRASLLDGRPDLEGLNWGLWDESANDGPVLCDCCHNDAEASRNAQEKGAQETMGLSKEAFEQLLTLSDVRQSSKVLIQAGMDGRFSWWQVRIGDLWFLVWGSEEGAQQEALEDLSGDEEFALHTTDQIAEALGMDREEFAKVFSDDDLCCEVYEQLESVNGGQFYVLRENCFFTEAR